MTTAAHGRPEAGWSNPYGVRVPRQNALLPGPPAPPRSDHPLVPWEDRSHVGQWADVDHAHEQLTRFTRSLDRLEDVLNPAVSQGRLVVVSGPLGMGKTSLIHRCVHEAMEYLGRLGRGAPQGPAVPRSVVVMTAGYGNDGGQMDTDDNGESAELRAINHQISGNIVESLDKHFPGDWPDRPQPGEEVAATSQRISALLAQQNALLFVLIPHIRWLGDDLRAGFLKTCLKRAVTRVVLFVEVSHGDGENADRVVAPMPQNAPLTHLALGPLGPEDTMKFSRCRPSGHPDVPGARTAPPAPPALPEQVRRGLLRAHEEWRPVDVRELRRVFYATADEHRRPDGPDGHLTYEDLRPHLPRRAPDLDGLRRDPRP